MAISFSYEREALWICGLFLLLVLPLIVIALIVQARRRKAATSPPVEVQPADRDLPVLVAGWYADPTERHQARYWDGHQWTDRVGDQGVPGTDPV